jgi:hypothetical protein
VDLVADEHHTPVPDLVPDVEDDLAPASELGGEPVEVDVVFTARGA